MKCNYSDIKQYGERFVDQYFVLENDAFEGVTKKLIIPDCTPGLMLIEKGGFTRKLGDEVLCFSEGQLILFGQKTKSVEYHFGQENLKAIGFKMMPQTINGLFGISADEITDKAIALKDIYKDSEMISENLLEGKVVSGLNCSTEIPNMLNLMLKDIHQSKGLIAINKLSELYNVGYKRMQRLFKLHIGITPKLYARIIRFNQSVNMSAFDKNNLTDVAYQSGYYDQNHFIKESKAFTGMVPSNLFNPDFSGIEPDHLAYLKARSY